MPLGTKKNRWPTHPTSARVDWTERSRAAAIAAGVISARIVSCILLRWSSLHEAFYPNSTAFPLNASLQLERLIHRGMEHLLNLHQSRRQALRMMVIQKKL